MIRIRYTSKHTYCPETLQPTGWRNIVHRSSPLCFEAVVSRNTLCSFKTKYLRLESILFIFLYRFLNFQKVIIKLTYLRENRNRENIKHTDTWSLYLHPRMYFKNKFFHSFLHLFTMFLLWTRHVAIAHMNKVESEREMGSGALLWKSNWVEWGVAVVVSCSVSFSVLLCQ